jgi:hypothetical protein
MCIGRMIIACLMSVPAWRKTHRAEKIDKYFDFKYLKIWAHINIFYTFFYKLCPVATPGHSEPHSLDNHIRIIALTPDLQRVSFYSVIEFFHYSSATELILCLILIKGSYQALGPHHYTGNRFQPCGCCGVQIYARSPRGSVQASSDFG